MKGIIRPSPSFRCGSKGLITLTPQELTFWGKKLSFPSKTRLFGAHVYYGPSGALVGPALGAPQAVMLLENLIAAGVRECLVYGWAGALRPEVSLASLWAVEEAFSAEGTSRYYQPKDCFVHISSPFLSLLLKKIAPFWGKTVSTDAPYRETPDFCSRWGERVHLIDMEMAALYAVASFYKINIVGLVVVSDRVWPKREQARPREIKKWVYVLLPYWKEFFLS